MFELLLARQEYGRPFALPPGTPPDVVATFRQAFAAMAKDEAFLQGCRKDARRHRRRRPGEEVAGLFAKTYGSPKPLVERAIATFKSASGKR